MNGSKVLLIIAATATAFLLAWALLDVIFGRTTEQRRIASLKVFTAAKKQGGASALRQLRAEAGERVRTIPVLSRFAARSEPLLDQLSGAPKPTEWLAIRAGCALAATLFAVAMVPFWLALPAGILLGFNLPTAVLQARIKRRRQRFNDDLPGMLHLMLSSLRSGFTLQQSVEAAVRDDEGPVAEELGRALSETRISGEFEDALERVGERVGSRELAWLVMALRLQKEVGGSLAEVMKTTADTMRERAYLRRHVSALSAEGRISAYVLTGLPVVTTGILLVIRPGYLEPLYTQPAGIAMALTAGLLMTVGLLWLRASVKIEV